MIGRQVCWSHPKLQRLAKRFVPAADEVWRLQNRSELDCELFQAFCEEGHYGGRTHPTDTRQGIYCCTPSGRFLASVNTTDPNRMARMLEEALEAWEALAPEERLLDYDPAARAGEIRRAEGAFPDDGLALRVYARDMPRRDAPRGWRRRAWNADSLWFRKAEARRLLPEAVEPGATHVWPDVLAERLVRHHLVDNVRGQTNSYAEEHVRRAEILTTVERVRDGVAHVTFSGRTRATTTGSWPEDGRYARLGDVHPHARGLQTAIRGEAAYDLEAERFVALELAARGTRWGRTRYNVRDDDLDEAPIGFAVVLDPAEPGRRVAPAAFGAYGW